MPSIAQITTFYENMGGVERSVRDLSLGLLRLNYDVTVLCTRKNASRVYTEDGIKVIASGSPISFAGRPVALGLARELSRKRFDLKHFHLPCPLATVLEQLAGDKSAIRVASWHHGIGKYPLFEAAYEPALRRFLKSVDRILVTAPPMIQFAGVLEEFADKCYSVPLGINTTLLEQAKPENVAEIRKGYNRPLILFVGRLVYYKGCDVLIKAMKNIDADLLISGEGPLHDQLVQLAADTGIAHKVHFQGRVSDDELAVLYNACDIFVLPSVLPTECFGLVQVEAMACGKPVINTNLPTGVPWVSKNGETGLTVVPGEVESLSAAIAKLLSDDPLRSKLGAGGKVRAYRYFTIDRQVELTHAIYSELFQDRNAEPPKPPKRPKRPERRQPAGF
jgi:glycosyltransferase involved in cell wall biosynthesis